VRTIPGCHTLDEVAESSCRMTLTAGVASIKETCQGDAKLTALKAPESFVPRAPPAPALGAR
jgi:carbon monoxide dehydrogenase subunit G